MHASPKRKTNLVPFLATAVSLISLSPVPAEAGCANAQGETSIQATENVTFGDFDADGIIDFIYGDPEAPSTDCRAQGTVLIRYGADIDTERVLSAAAPCDAARGTAVAAGDLNGDGYDDLAVGNPGAEQVQIHLGGPAGLGATSETLAPGSASSFGSALAIGDFDDDGYDDLAVGAPFATVRAARNAGEVYVFAGSSRGIATTASTIQADSFGIDEIEANAYFGAMLLSDRLRTGGASLVASEPGRDAGGLVDAGALHVLFGGPRGFESPVTYRIDGTSEGSRLGLGVSLGTTAKAGVLELALLKGGMWLVDRTGATYDTSNLRPVNLKGVPVEPPSAYPGGLPPHCSTCCFPEVYPCTPPKRPPCTPCCGPLPCCITG